MPATLPSYRRGGHNLALPVPDAIRPNLVATVARLDRLRDQAEDRQLALPWNCATADDARQMQAWHDAWARYDRAWIKDLLMVVIPDLEDFKPKQAEKLTNVSSRPSPNPQRIRALGRALKDLDEFVKAEVLPIVTRLEKGMARMEALPLSQDADERHTAFLELWISLRKEVRDALPAGWRILVVVRDLFEALDEAGRDEAVSIWGPFRGQDSRDYGPIFQTTWPAARLADLDRRAQIQGVVDLDNPFPNTRPQPKRQP